MISSYFSPKKKTKSKELSNKVVTPSSKEHSEINTKKRTRGDESSEDGTNPKRTATAKTPTAALSSTSLSKCPEVEKILDHLQDQDTSAEEIASWRKSLERHTSSHQFRQLAKFVSSERERSSYKSNCRGAVYPPPEETFAALNLTPLHSVKVVIVGQDPYHGFNQGHGLAFSVKHGVAIPPSLRNIYKELIEDPNVSFDNHCKSTDSATKIKNPYKNNYKLGLPNHGHLMRWANQGVLLLNSVLTVRHSEANSHAKKGWEQFTDEVIRSLVRHNKASQGGLVFLLWGKPASKKAENIVSTQNKRHVVICTSHPSPLGATKTKSPFLGSRCFSRANEELVKMGMEPIDWNVDDA